MKGSAFGLKVQVSNRTEFYIASDYYINEVCQSVAIFDSFLQKIPPEDPQRAIRFWVSPNTNQQ